MKYFIERFSFSGYNPVHEIAAKTAMRIYKDNAGSGFYNLTAIPNFQKGINVTQPFCKIWGEEITEAECFRRKLKGTLLDGFWEKGND